MATSFNLLSGSNLSLVEAGEWLQIDAELMAVVSLVGSTLTVKRGVLDTVPANHTAGAQVLFWDGISTTDPTEYVASDVVDVKFTAANGSGVYPLATAVAMPVNVVGRAARPFPPGNVKFNGAYYPAASLSLPVTVTWARRNRVLQTGGSLIGFTDGDVTPEAGQTTEVAILSDTGSLLWQATGIVGTTQVLDEATITATAGNFRVRIRSVRSGLISMQEHDINILVVLSYDGAALPFEMTDAATATGGAVAFTMGA